MDIEADDDPRAAEARIGYFRAPSGEHEVDIIIERAGRVIAIEVKLDRRQVALWRRRFIEGGIEALFDRSSRPHSSGNRTTHNREVAVLAARAELRQGPLRLAAETGVPARTISRILARHGVPWLSWCDPVTGRVGISAEVVVALQD